MTHKENDIKQQAAMILTRQQRDRSDGIELTYWVRYANSVERVVIRGQRSIFFTLQRDRQQIERLLSDLDGWVLEPLSLSSFNQEPVEGLYSEKLSIQKAIIDRLALAGVTMMEEDVRPCDRYLMERFIKGAVLVEKKAKGGVILKPADARIPLRYLSLDIETTFQGDLIHSIALSAPDFESVLMRGSGQADPSLSLQYCEDEATLILRFCQQVQAYDPDLLLGWNLIGFDLSVLQKRAAALQLKLTLGRDSQPLQLASGVNGRRFARIAGRLAVDGIDAMKSASMQFERYGLEYIAQTLLGEGKEIDHPDQRSSEIQRLYHQDKPALARYNLQDARLVWRIFEKTNLIDYLMERALLTGLPLDKVGGSAAAFDFLYLPMMHRAGYVAPKYASGVGELSVPGGFVMESKPGLYEHVLVFDFKSLYPSIIRTFCIDPVGLAEGLKEGTLDAEKVAGFHGAIFSSRVSLLPDLIATLWQARDRAKREQKESYSHAIKIIMNACYGVLGSSMCRFYDQRLSGSITLRGHQILQQTREYIEMNSDFQVIYGDTDSVFVWLGDDVDSARVEQIGRSLAADINQWWSAQIEERFGLPSYLELQYETHYAKFLMPRMRGSDKGSKKRYAGLKQTHEGDRLVFKGLENVRSDWTPLARRFQEEIYRRVFFDQPWRAYLQQTVRALRAGELDEQLIYRKRLRRPLDMYQKNRPPHVQAALLARSLQQEQRGSSIEQQREVAYWITVHGAEPVEYRRSLIDYDHYIEKQLKPVADSVLMFIGESFEELIDDQYSLF